jgi:hypothetical protein
VISGEKDIETVKDLIAEKQLDSTVAKLDPDDVRHSIRAVPDAVIRLLVVGLRDPLAEKQIATLKSDQREPLQHLLEAAKRQRGQEFVKAFLAAAKDDEKISARLGFKTTDVLPVTLSEAKAYNTVSRVTGSPMMMLQSSRLYAEIAFLQLSEQGERLLFRSTMELDEVLAISGELLGIAFASTQLVQKKAASAKPKLAIRRCTELLKEIRKHVGGLSGDLAKLEKSGRKKAH